MSRGIFIALLRGINVGGKNIIPMAELRTLFEEAGFAHVETYIQSGNVVFSSPSTSVSAIRKKIEQGLLKQVGAKIHVVLISAKQLSDIVEKAPEWFGLEPNLYKYDIAFLSPEVDVESFVLKIPLREGVDRAAAGREVVYFAKLIEKASQSRLPQMIALPEYRLMTVRNRNTVMQLATMTNSP